MKKNVLIKLIVAVCVIVPAFTFFMVEVIRSNVSYYYSVDEFAKQDAGMRYANEFRLAGKVKPGSIERDIDKAQLRFILAGSSAELPVSYSRTVPDNFAENKEVLVDGRLDPNGVFQAQLLLTRCESKYKKKLE